MLKGETGVNIYIMEEDEKIKIGRRKTDKSIPVPWRSDLSGSKINSVL
jgi:hypothetical protein